ncbi:hypothetical protein PYCCODRAFT_1448042 [Trametes coccinea BRFM310]|uniref:DUF6570 domain-containing protein n=1 Tax=Trametes coccinea (strain BRFM310) TaxID=1353009 RepID=A0A1Y2I8D1_TRAC3|nr:hypothetical protein PYCCODRAFT_1448042 [Trametes coccinea BRFM310]
MGFLSVKAKIHRFSNQRGLKGHVIIHPQRPEKLATVLPPVIDDIITPICVIFVGSERPSREWLEKKAKPLVVRRERILAALQWLKANNPLYSDVRIDADRVAALPANGMLPHDIQYLHPTESTSATTARYDHADVSSVNEPSIENLQGDNVPFSKVIITDVDGRAPSSELKAAAIRHIKCKGGGYLSIPHEPKPINEFCNPTLFPKIYPSLFPYGVGGCEDPDRQKPVSLRRHIGVFRLTIHFCLRHSTSCSEGRSY